jgi:competence protein ComEC
MILTGMTASVVRATIMGAVFLTSYLTNRSNNIFNSLSLSAIIILLFAPDELFNPGFQLSFSAVAAIGIFTSFFHKIIFDLKIKSKAIKYILLFMAVSLGAQIGTLPFTLAYFNKLSITAIAANLIVIPLTGIMVGIAFFTLCLNLISPFIASLYAAANNLLNEFLFRFTDFAGSEKFSFLWIRGYSIVDAIIFYFLAFFFLYNFKKFHSGRAKFALIILITGNLLFLSSLDDKKFFNEGELNILMVDVGQGDAILIKFPDNRIALIDAGDVNPYFDNGKRVIIPLLNHLGIEKINYAFISHLDADHYGGFISLIKDGLVEKVVKPFPDSSLKDTRFETFIRKNNIPVSYFNRRSMNIAGVKLFYLNDIKDKFYSALSTNDKSGMIKLVYGKRSFLFPGDIESKAEEYYSARYKNFLKCDLLKVAHHGSITSSSPEFINYSKPVVSLISAGIQNKFNHPSSIVLNRLNSINSKILRTDKSGAVLIRSDGNLLSIVDWKEF